MEDITFKHQLPLQIRFNDVDKFGHVNNTVYFSFYDLGKTEYFLSVCPDVNWEKDAIMVVHIEVDFISQMFSTDSMMVQTTVTEIGNKSFKLLQRLIERNTGEIKCVCRSIMVAYDLETRQSVPLSETWISAICENEGKDLRRKS